MCETQDLVPFEITAPVVESAIPDYAVPYDEEVSGSSDSGDLPRMIDEEFGVGCAKDYSPLRPNRAADRVIVVARNVDSFFRSSDTVVAKICDVISPKRGKDYLHSWQKRTLDLIVAIPATCIAMPVSLLLGLLQHISDGGPMFFWQDRLNSDLNTTFRMPKIRSMAVGADDLSATEKIAISVNHSADNDPRISGIGRFLRQTDVDELPQILQVLTGIQGIVGNRAIPQYAFTFMSENLPKEVMSVWVTNYRKHLRPGIVGVSQIFRENRKDDLRRVPYDNFYSENASLGFDLYILWRTFLKLSRLEKFL